MHVLEQGQRSHDSRRQLDRVEPLRAFLKHIGDFVDHVDFYPRFGAIRSAPDREQLLNASHKRVVRVTNRRTRAARTAVMTREFGAGPGNIVPLARPFSRRRDKHHRPR
jgi:hypothetical protein